jgi:hypothetical protein
MTLLFVAAAPAQQSTNWSLDGSQFLFIIILVFAVIGFQRGWRRELVSFGFSMGALLLLFIDQGKWIADFLFNKLPEIGQLISGSSTASSTNNVNDGNLLLTRLLVLAVMITVGYLVGNKAFPRPTTPPERLFGILPAIVGGFFLVFYLTNYLQSTDTTPGGTTSQVTFGVNTPNQNTIGNSVLIIFIIAVVVVVVALIAANAKKPSGGGGKK